jgi:hypothetical protein
MFDFIDPTNHLHTAALAIGTAEGLAPFVRHRLPMLLPDGGKEECATIADILVHGDIFKQATIVSLRDFLVKLDDVIDGTTVARREWAPVRCLDGYEDWQEVTIRGRTERGDAIAAIAAELERVIELTVQTAALRRACELLKRMQ